MTLHVSALALLVTSAFANPMPGPAVVPRQDTTTATATASLDLPANVTAGVVVAAAAPVTDESPPVGCSLTTRPPVTNPAEIRPGPTLNPFYCVCSDDVEVGLYTSIDHSGVGSVYCSTGTSFATTGAVSTILPTGTPGDP